MTDNNGSALVSDAPRAKANKPAKAKVAAWDLNNGSMTYGIRSILARNVALSDGARNAEAVRTACRAAGITSPDATIDTITADFRASLRALRAAGRIAEKGGKKGN